MATAKISMSDGTSVEVNGTPEEVAAVLADLKINRTSPALQVLPARSRKASKGEIPGLIDSLKSEDFFKAPRKLADIQKKLAELGHHYPVTSLSGAMQVQSRNRNLRRFKQNGKYVYVQ
jgi:superfamily II DNA/RNA helicase